MDVVRCSVYINRRGSVWTRRPFVFESLQLIAPRHFCLLEGGERAHRLNPGRRVALV